jgi:hypothetical protein
MSRRNHYRKETSRMELSTLMGLPAHPLLVHAAVVLVPAAALAMALTVLWAPARDRLGWAAPGLAVLAALVVPVVAGSGEALQQRVPDTALVREHTELGEQLAPVVFALALFGVVHLLVQREAERAAQAEPRDGRWSRRIPPWALGTPVRIGLVVLVLLSATASTVQVARIGHSGARAVWSENGGTARTPAPAGTAYP